MGSSISQTSPSSASATTSATAEPPLPSRGLVAPAKSGSSSPRPAATPLAPHKLRGISDIRRFFIRNQEPIYFISATNFNLLNMDEWVHRFRFINYIDCFDGHHPNILVPSERPHDTFESLEEIVNYLLEHPEVENYIRSRGDKGKAAFLFFDEKTEELCERLGLEICFPSAKLRDQIDNKMNTTRIGNRARVLSVPNVLAKNVKSYPDLLKKSKKLGEDLVVQTAFGDSGHTTFFIKSEDDWQRHADEIVGQPEIKIMKRITPRQAAVEACVTRAGTIVGPLMTELVGFSEMTPYRGGWCGNEVFAGAFSKKVRERARKKTVAIGEELSKMGYRGYFEVDYLVDADDGKVYLGEINPRVTGASSMTNLSAFAHADAPLFLFHLLEFFDVDFELDVEALNERWSDPVNIDTWSQMVLKYTGDQLEQVTAAPPSGVWTLDSSAADGRVSWAADGSGLRFVRPQTHRRTVERESEGFFLRIARQGDYRYEGADLGILITPGRLMNEDGQLNERAKAWVAGINAHFQGVPVEKVEKTVEVADLGGFKFM